MVLSISHYVVLHLYCSFCENDVFFSLVNDSVIIEYSRRGVKHCGEELNTPYVTFSVIISLHVHRPRDVKPSTTTAENADILRIYMAFRDFLLFGTSASRHIIYFLSGLLHLRRSAQHVHV